MTVSISESTKSAGATAGVDLRLDRAAAHPDAGGGREAWDDLVAAYDQAKMARQA
jgi:hypothetical protein